MEKPLKGKIALVTGASKGIGKAAALRLGHEGAAVIVNYASDRDGAHNVAQLIRTAGGMAVALQGDVGKVVNIRRMFAEVDGILKGWGAKTFDILVNNAGVFPMGGPADATEEVVDQMFGVNVKGLFFMTQEAVKRMAGGGRIVNVSSVLTRAADPALGIYCASKGAVDIMTRDFAAHLGPRGITVNSVQPGRTVTDGTAARRSQEVLDRIAGNTALKRIAYPDDIADAIAFLCGHDARWVTACRLEVSGGYRLS